MRRRAVHLHWVDDGADGPAGDQWPLGSGKTMSFTFQGAGVKNVRVTVTDADGDTDSTMKADHGRRGRPAGRHDRARHDDHARARPARPATARRRSRSPRRGRVDVRVPLDSGGVGDCTSPWTTAGADRRRAHVRCARPTPRATSTRRRRRRAFTVDTRPRRTPRARHHDRLGPDRADQRHHADVRLHRDEAGSTFAVPRRHRRVRDLHQPVDDAGAERRRPHVRGPRDRRGGQHRRHAGDAVVHASTPGPEHDDQLGAARADARLERDAWPSAPTETGATFECRLDAPRGPACTSPKTYTRPRAGASTRSTCAPPTRPATSTPRRRARDGDGGRSPAAPGGRSGPGSGGRRNWFRLKPRPRP